MNSTRRGRERRDDCNYGTLRPKSRGYHRPKFLKKNAGIPIQTKSFIGKRKQYFYPNKKWTKEVRPVKPRSPSPVIGSEEYMVQKIQKTSADIMKQLLNPNRESLCPCIKETVPEKGSPLPGISSKHNNIPHSNKSSGLSGNKPKQKKESTERANIEEIHTKIINHITNLNNGKKRNLINANSSGYDYAIEHIQKQKRLEISRALRNMCSQNGNQEESSNLINSIIPDMGIKIEDLPRELIEELSQTINIDFESYISEDFEYDLRTENNVTKEVPFICNVNDNINVFSASEYCQEQSGVVKKEAMVIEQHSQIAKKEIKLEIQEETNIIKKHPQIYKKEIILENLNNEEANVIEQSFPISEKEIKLKTLKINELENVIKESPLIFKKDLKLEIQDEVNFNEQQPLISECNIKQEIIEEPLEELKFNIGQSVHLDSKESADADLKYNYLLPETINNTSIHEMADITFKERYLNSFTQTEETPEQSNTNCDLDNFTEYFLTNCRKNSPQNISETVKRMLKVDECIKHFNEYRQTLYSSLVNLDETSVTEEFVTTKEECVIENVDNTNKQADDGPPKKRLKKDETVTEHHFLLNLENVQEKILVVKVINNGLVAGSEGGKLFFFSLKDGHVINTLQVSYHPITWLEFDKMSENQGELYVGSSDNDFRVYSLRSYKTVLMRTFYCDDSVQCMENQWGYVFVGCTRGTLIRCSKKKKKIEYEDKLSNSSILVLKATQEGARRVLLVASRFEPVCIRDAMTGLHMRTMENIVSPTVYSLIMDKNQVYCGTTNHDILVFNFHDGKLIQSYKDTESKGVGCLKIKENLLFASCHNGRIYVYDVTLKKLIGSIEGPGSIILCMEILENQIIVGTINKFQSVPIPQTILQHLI